MKKQHKSQGISWLWRLVGTTVVYCAVGFVGILLVLSPDHSTTFWFASGIALCAVLLRGYNFLPGIWLGAFLVDFWIGSHVSKDVALTHSVSLAASLALGVVGQAFLGGWLIRRFVGYPTALERESDIIKFLAFGGPLSCAVGTTFAILGLLLHGAIVSEAVLSTWWTWWIGDSIGVLVTAPLVLLMYGEPRQAWQRRRASVGIPLCLMLVVVLAVFLYSRSWERARTQLDFERRAELLSGALNREVERHMESLYVVRQMFDSSRYMERDEFHKYVTPFFDRLAGVQALEWVPRVHVTEREAYEESARWEGWIDFQITERDHDGRFVPVKIREWYYPVYYVEPYGGNEELFGYDLGSDGRWLMALHQARDTGQPAITGQMPIVHGYIRQTGVLVVLPVYPMTVPYDFDEEEHYYLEGFVCGIFNVGEIVDAALREFTEFGIDLRVYDDAAPSPEQLLCVYRLRKQEHELFLLHDKPPKAPEPAWQTTIDLAGRRWRLEFAPTVEYFLAQRSWQTWAMLAAGLLFTAFFGAFLLILTGRTAKISRMVELRTNELSKANQELKREVHIRKEAEEALRGKTDELETTADALSRSNKELEQFAYIASHDLQEPLRTVSAFSELLRQDLGDNLPETAERDLGFLIDAATRMRRLIQDLLEFSRVRKARIKQEAIPLGRCVDDALHALSRRIEETGAQVSRDALPTVAGDKRMLTQLYQNLIANALKFIDQVPPKIHLTAARQPDGWWELGVKDNGIGIEPEFCEQIFRPFRRLHTTDEYEGTGIGLAICQKAVVLHGGAIWAESEGNGKGTHIKFTLNEEQAED